MVQVSKVNKYFNKAKRNQIHVIKDTTLSFESTGLVALVGPSGSGKTTLLNVIGGLDKIGSGKVFINGKKITRRTANRTDEIRNANIGYVFQNFNLVDDMSVFENVALVLKMIGIKDEKVIRERVYYVLEKLKMYRFRNRNVQMLSGGERQRVGIARAIVKNPAILIADEPTGNLDSENTYQIMNFLKSISKERLVILVTHESKLAEFYADRIISLQDGAVIDDKVGTQSEELDYNFENKIYLGDMKKIVAKHDDNEIRYYSQSEKEKINLDIVLRNGNIYIRSNNSTQRIEIVQNNGGIQLEKGKYKAVTREESNLHIFDTSILDNKRPIKYKSILKIYQIIGSGFKKVSNYSISKKLLLIGFVFSSIFMLYSISSIFGITDLDETQFVNENKDYYSTLTNDMTPQFYEQLKQDPNVKYVLPGTSTITFQFNPNSIIQATTNSSNLRAALSDIQLVTESDLIAGRMPESPAEILVDKLALEKCIQDGSVSYLGYTSPEKFLNEQVEIPLLPEFTIVGITDLGHPSVHIDMINMVNMMALSSDENYDYYGYGSYISTPDTSQDEGADLTDYTLVSHRMTLKHGAWPVNDYEVIIMDGQREEHPLGSALNETVGGVNLKVVGYYTTTDQQISGYYTSNSTIEKNLIANTDTFTIMPNDFSQPIVTLDEAVIPYESTYEREREEYSERLSSFSTTAIRLAIVAMAISILEIYLMLRTSFLSRIKEVGVYRAIGVKKRDIYKMFVGEIIAITIIGGIPGISFMTYILYELVSIEMLADMFMLNSFVVGLAFAVIFCANLIFGLLPVILTLRKSPATILSRTDVV